MIRTSSTLFGQVLGRRLKSYFIERDMRILRRTMFLPEESKGQKIWWKEICLDRKASCRERV